MSTDPNGFMPPTPRDRDVPTLSEIIPFRSKQISIRRSKVLMPFLIVGCAVVAFFFAQTHSSIIDIFACLVVGGIFLTIYTYADSRKRWWWYILPALLAWYLLDKQFWVYALVFRKMLPGDLAGLHDTEDFLPTFRTYFFAAGLCEEALKATPALLALAAALLFGRAALPAPAVPGRRAWGSAIVRGLTLRGPLDGLLTSCAAGAAFILYETLGEYIPDQIGRTMTHTQNAAAAQLAGLELVIPRALQGVSGHMAWAGIFGYFVGLSARYPKRAVTLVPLGFLLAATLHAFWDSAGTLPMPPLWFGLDTVVTVLLFVGCLLKAKQLELAWHGPNRSSDSILVGAPAAGGALSGLRMLASGVEAAAGAPVTPETAPAGRFSIGTGADRYALDAGSAIDFAALFGDRGAPAGSSGEIDRHPTEPDVLGLKNTGTAPWVSTTPKGATVSVPQGRSLRIAEGTRIAFGALVLDIETY